MKRGIGFIGAFGLVVLLFGLIGQFLLAEDDYHFVPIHLGLGAFLLILFLFGGGLHGLKARSVSRKAGASIGAVLYVAIFLLLLVAVNIWAFRNDPLHFDSTQEKVYTLAPESTSILASLPKKVIVRSFNLGGKVDPAVEVLLNRFQSASENFSWTVVDPEKKPQLVEQLGITQSGTIHFSFEGEAGQREAKIARDITEQEIDNALLKLTRGEGKKVYLIVGHGEADTDSQSDTGFLFLRDNITGENLKVEKFSIGTSGDIPADASAILLLGPKKQILPEEIKKIETYLAAGGAAVFTAEPHTNDDIARLLQPLGIEVRNDIIIDRSLTGFGVQLVVSQYGVHPITNGFAGSTVFSTARSVGRALKVPEGARVTELVLSGENSWAETDVEKIYGEKPEATPNPEELHGPVSLAVAYEGLAPYALAEGKQAAKSRIVVFGDVDFVSNVKIRQLFNADLFLNSLNWVLGEEQGVTVRPRSLKQSAKIISPEQMAHVFLTAGVLFPEALIVIGLAIWYRRRS